jgi:hypothetical protein
MRNPAEWNDIASINSALSFPANCGEFSLGISWATGSLALAGGDTDTQFHQNGIRCSCLV